MDQEVRGRETCRRRGENTKGRGPWAINDEAADKGTGVILKAAQHDAELGSREPKEGARSVSVAQDGMVRSPRFRLTKVDCSLGRDGWMATWGL